MNYDARGSLDDDERVRDGNGGVVYRTAYQHFIECIVCPIRVSTCPS